MEIIETIEFIQKNIERMLHEMNKDEESFLKMYGDSNKIHLAFAMGQREMLRHLLEIQTQIREEE